MKKLLEKRLHYSQKQKDGGVISGVVTGFLSGYQCLKWTMDAA